MTATRRQAIARRTAIPQHLVLLLSLLTTQAWAKDPAILYAIECQGCHLSDGSGGLATIPTLTGHVARFLDVPGGREYLVQVPGVALSSLSDRDLTEVLNWMLHRFGPADALQRNPPYATDEVARLRKQPMTEVVRTRAALQLLIDQGVTDSALQ